MSDYSWALPERRPITVDFLPESAQCLACRAAFTKYARNQVRCARCQQERKRQLQAVVNGRRVARLRRTAPSVP